MSGTGQNPAESRNECEASEVTPIQALEAALAEAIVDGTVIPADSVVIHVEKLRWLQDSTKTCGYYDGGYSTDVPDKGYLNFHIEAAVGYTG